MDADTGELLWTRQADTHAFARITGTPTLHAGRLYVPVSSLEEAAGGLPDYACCTFRGSIVAYARDGRPGQRSADVHPGVMGAPATRGGIHGRRTNRWRGSAFVPSRPQP